MYFILPTFPPFVVVVVSFSVPTAAIALNYKALSTYSISYPLETCSWKHLHSRDPCIVHLLFLCVFSLSLSKKTIYIYIYSDPVVFL